jgi:adenylate cyclase
MLNLARKSKHLRVLAFALLTAVVAAHALHWTDIPALTRLELMLYDARLRLAAPAEIDTRIVIVDIDEKSLREKDMGGEGHWPWPRSRLANLLQKLIDEQEVSLVGVDFIFSEKDNSSGLSVLENLAKEELKANKAFTDALQKLTPSLEYDKQFAEQIVRAQVVLGAAFHNHRPVSYTHLRAHETG